uniref:Uncharacterized protein n=1 Tax=Anguilla anguilla TaxID=7936 RepID=A0A0E9TER9_ANGAN
MLMHVQPCG